MTVKDNSNEAFSKLISIIQLNIWPECVSEAFCLFVLHFNCSQSESSGSTFTLLLVSFLHDKVEKKIYIDEPKLFWW